MKRRMKLIGLILKHVEQAPHTGEIQIPEFQDYTRNEVEYHVTLCSEAGYLDIVVDPRDKTPVMIHRLTWEGHEALEKLYQKKTGCQSDAV